MTEHRYAELTLLHSEAYDNPDRGGKSKLKFPSSAVCLSTANSKMFSEQSLKTLLDSKQIVSSLFIVFYFFEQQDCSPLFGSECEGLTGKLSLLLWKERDAPCPPPRMHQLGLLCTPSTPPAIGFCIRGHHSAKAGWSHDRHKGLWVGSLNHQSRGSAGCGWQARGEGQRMGKDGGGWASRYGVRRVVNYR